MMSQNDIKKTVLFTEKSIKDSVDQRVEELEKLTGIKKSRIMEAALVSQLLPQHPKAKIWDNIQLICEQNGRKEEKEDGAY